MYIFRLAKIVFTLLITIDISIAIDDRFAPDYRNSCPENGIRRMPNLSDMSEFERILYYRCVVSKEADIIALFKQVNLNLDKTNKEILDLFEGAGSIRNTQGEQYSYAGRSMLINDMRKICRDPEKRKYFTKILPEPTVYNPQQTNNATNFEWYSYSYGENGPEWHNCAYDNLCKFGEPDKLRVDSRIIYLIDLIKNVNYKRPNYHSNSNNQKSVKSRMSIVNLID